jgi:hypothetical protein
MDIKLTFEEHDFEGHVVVGTVSNSKRGRALKAIGLRDPSKLESLGWDEIDALIENSQEYYKEVDLKYEGVELKSFDDMDNHSACYQLMQETAMKIFIGLGKDTKK